MKSGIRKKKSRIFLIVSHIACMCAAGQPYTAAADAAMSPFWRVAAAGAVIGEPSAQAGSVVVALDGGAVKAYSWQGALLWEYFAAGKLCPFITRSWDGTGYFCRVNGRLFAINRAGQELWSVDIRAPIIAPVVAGWDGRLFVTTARETICFNSEGRRLWRRPLEAAVVIPPRLDKEGGVLLALEDGAVLWISAFGAGASARLEETPAVMLSIDHPRYGKRAALVWYADGRGCLIAPDADGVQSAPVIQPPPLPAPPIAAREHNGEIAVVLSDGRLLMLSAAPEGWETLWEADTGIRGISPDEISLLNEERGVYVLSQRRALGFSRAGAVKWALNIGQASGVPAFSSQGVLYSGGLDWILYAFQLETAMADSAQTDSPYGAAPQGDYGLGTLPLQRSRYEEMSDYSLAFHFQRIRDKIKRGELGEDEPVFIEYLKEAAASMRNSIAAPQTNPPVQLARRVEAARLLAEFGSRELVSFFADLFLYDKEPLVKAAAAWAIGRIGVDPKGAAMEAFARTIIPPVITRDEQTLAAVAAAVGSLCRVSGPPMTALGAPILAGLAAPDKPPEARKRALLELERLQN
jgi:outer membrane protein assembly factor BamB